MSADQPPQNDEALAQMWRAWSAMAAAPSADALAPWISAMKSPPAMGSPLNLSLAQAHMAAMGTLMRAGSRCAESWGQYLSASATAPAADGVPDPAASGRQIDEARAHLRRFAEIVGEEAATLSTQMSLAAEQLRVAAAAQAPDAAVEPGPARRYARAKP